jgi:hypothetical protein
MKAIRATTLVLTLTGFQLLCAGPGLCGTAAPDFAAGREADADFNLTLLVTPPRSGSLDLWIGRTDVCALMRFKLGSASLEWHGPGQAPNPVTTALPPQGETGREYLLKYRSGASPRVSLVADGRELARLPLPPTEGERRLAFTGSGSARITLYQKIDRSEPVLFTDDFTRQDPAITPWKADRPGEWKICADPNPGTSASPFAMECTAAAEASMARTGEEFWDDCLVSAAVSLAGSPGAAGLAFNLSPRGGYLLRLRAEGPASGGAGCAELVRLDRAGSEKVLLSRAMATSPGSWYLLQLTSSGKRLRAWVDGAELADVPDADDLCGGQIGLWSAGTSGARFDDVRVRAVDSSPTAEHGADPALELALRRWHLEPAVIPDYFRKDPTMSSWARLTEDFRASGNVVWHRSRLAGSQEISWCRPGQPLRGGQIVLALCADGNDLNSGYRLVADLGADPGHAVLSVFEREHRVAGTVAALTGAGIERLSFSRESGLLVAAVGSRTVMTTPDSLKLPGGRAGAAAMGGGQLQRGELRVAAGSLLDEVFARAPVEWQAVTGSWEVASRWLCDPEFTWMLGRQRRGLARLDLKRPLNGDFAMDIFMAVGMAERGAPFYDFPTNLSIALSERPDDPTSGFVLYFGGIDQPSRIVRNGTVLASGAGLVHRDPRGQGTGEGLHGHWFHIRVIRSGRRLELHGDGQQLCSAEDPAVEAPGRVSLWTIGDNGAVLARVRIEAAAELGQPRSPFLPGREAARPLAPLPEAWRHFTNRDGSSGALVTVTDNGRKLRLTNVNAGGSFAAAWAPPGGIDLAEHGWLEFDWRTSPGARINLYLVKGGQFHRVRLTEPAGRQGGRYNLRHLGEVPGAQAYSPDYRHFAFDLGAALAAAESSLADLCVDEIRIGNCEFEETALLEGTGGNHAGEWVELAGWHCGGEPAGKLRIRPGLALAPRLGELKPGQRLDNFARLDPRSAYVVAGNWRFAFDGAALRYDAFSGTFVFSPRLAGCQLKSGTNELRLGCNGFRRASLNSTAAYTLDFDLAADRVPPRPPRLITPVPLEQEDFERSLGRWEPLGGSDGARLNPDTPGPEGEGRCLLAENTRCGGTLGAVARAVPLQARRYPTLSFDCRIEPRTRVNLLLLLTGDRRLQLFMTDDRGGAQEAGRVEGAAGDGQWHRLTADLYEALSRREHTVIHSIALADLGPGSSTTAEAWRVDNWTILPALNGSRSVDFAWQAADESGIAGYAAVLDRRPDTEPPAEIGLREGRLRAEGGLAEGLWYLHVRARDGAGNWSGTTRWPFRVFVISDREPPQVASVSPAEGASGCPQFIEAVVKDKTPGLSPHDIALTAGNVTFRPGDPGVVYYTAEDRLRVSLLDRQGRLRLPPGPVRCELRAADAAGNVMPAHAWTWTLSPAEDKKPPDAPRVTYLPSDRLLFQDFEDGQGTFCNWRRGVAWRWRDREGSGTGMGNWFLHLGSRWNSRTKNEVLFWPEPFDAQRYPLLSFDYRIQPGTAFDIVLESGNRFHSLTVGQRPVEWQGRVGRLPSAIADGRWHRLEADLRKLELDKSRSIGQVQQLLATFEESGVDIDNFVLASPFGSGAEFLWAPPVAASGIAGYSWSFDGKPDTEPPTEVTGTEPRAQFASVAPGTHYFHVRARSGAGIWGGTAHTRIVIEPKR